MNNEIVVERPVSVAAKKYKKKSQLKVIWTRFKRNKLAVIGMVVFVLMLIAVLGANMYLDYEKDALEQNIRNRLQPASAEHWFGTDQYGRDEFSRVIFGGRISMFVGIATVLVSLSAGSLIGAVSAYYGGQIDNVLMRIMDVFLAIPSMLFAIALISALGTNLFNLILAMGISQIPRMSRIVRSAIMSVKEMDFIEACRSCGTSDSRIIWRHILPNAMGPILVQVTQTVARSVITIASLSFIGLGISEPTPEWGSMLSEAKNLMRYHSHLALFPGIAIVMSVMSLTLMGDGLRDAMDPRLRN